MLKIVYCSDGELITDLKAEAYAKKHLDAYFSGSHEDTVISVGTEVMFSCFVMLLIEDKYPSEEVYFFYENEPIPYDNVNGIDDTKDGKYILPMCYADIVDRIIDAGYKHLVERRDKHD